MMNRIKHTQPFRGYKCIKQYVYCKNIGSVEICTEDDNKTWLCSLYVFPEYRNRGMATRLMKKALKICKRRGIKKLWLKSAGDLIPFYSKLGFTYISVNDNNYYTMIKNI